MDYLIESDISPCSLFFLSAITSVYVSNSKVWIMLNCLLPFINYHTICLGIPPEHLPIDEVDVFEMNKVTLTIDYWMICALTMSYTHQWLGWAVLPISTGIYTFFHNYSDVHMYKDVSFTLAIMKLVPQTILVFPIALVAGIAYYSRKVHNPESYSYKLYTWQWYICVTAILCIASYSV